VSQASENQPADSADPRSGDSADPRTAPAPTRSSMLK